MIREERLFRLFCDLCLINSPPLQERECVLFVRNLLESRGFSVWEDNASQKIGGNANNLYAKLPANQTGIPGIFFSAHFDTVEPTEGLVIEERDGIFYSNGKTILGADDKGGMAPILEAVFAIQESDIPHGDIFLVLTCAEEIGLKGAYASDFRDLNVSYGYVFDTGPPVGSFVSRVGTHDRIRARILGKPAHAGKDPEKGINSIQVASLGIAAMRLGKIDEETTANIGTIRGGTATNVVPAETVITGEARSFDKEKLRIQIEHMVTCLEKAAQDGSAIAEIEVERAYEGYEHDKNSKVVQVALEAARRLGWNYDLRSTLGGSDANVFTSRGIPAVVCGTGMEEIHTHQEHIAKTDLVNSARLAIEIVKVTSERR